MTNLPYPDDEVLPEDLTYDPWHCRACGKGDEEVEILWYDEFADHYHSSCIPEGV